MSSTEIPHWHTLITTFRKKRIITNGLTIPYLVGAYDILNGTETEAETAIRQLISSFIESPINAFVLIHKCDVIDQIIIDPRYYFNHKNDFKEDFSIRNHNKEIKIIIGPSVSYLGKDLDAIINSFIDMYANDISNKFFSWSKDTKTWHKFSNMETASIKILKQIN